MENYTFSNIIIDPEKGKPLIGKEVFFGNKPSKCLKRAKQGTHYAELVGISPNDKKPFKFNDEKMSMKGYQCIILKDC